MAKVKGSKQERLVVRAHRPVRTLLIRIVVVSLVLFMGLGGYWYGQRTAFQRQAEVEDEIIRLKQEVVQKSNELSESRLVAVAAEKGAQVDQMANEEVRQLNRQLLDQIADLEAEVALYKGIMAPAIGNKGLTIKEFEIDSTTDLNRYRFKLMLTQVGTNKDYIQGVFGVNFVGKQGGKDLVLPLKDVSTAHQKLDIKFRYKYFQDEKGEVVFPDGFIPERVQVVAQATGKKAMRVEKFFDWNALEITNNAGQ